MGNVWRHTPTRSTILRPVMFGYPSDLASCGKAKPPECFSEGFAFGKIFGRGDWI